MRELDTTGMKLCRAQAELFALSRSETECSSPVFIRQFMNSSLAKRLDGNGFLFESSSPSGMLQEIEDEYGKSAYGTKKYSVEELYWMGYLYRYWCYVFETPSTRVFKSIGARELHDLYFPYHSLDPEQAVRRIAEAKGIDLDEDPIEKGVRALRRIRSRSTYQYYCSKMES